MAGAISSCSSVQNQQSSLIEKPYTADWDSLVKHNESPNWFLDAKLGIYFYWGVFPCLFFKTCNVGPRDYTFAINDLLHNINSATQNLVGIILESFLMAF